MLVPLSRAKIGHKRTCWWPRGSFFLHCRHHPAVKPLRRHGGLDEMGKGPARVFKHLIILEKATLQTSGRFFRSAAFAFVQLFHQVNGGSVKCLLWRAVPGTIVKYTRLVLHMAVGVESHRPIFLITKVPKPAKMRRDITQLCNTLFSWFTVEEFWVVIRRDEWFRICIDITKLPAETDVNAIVPIGVVLFRMIQYALPYLRLHCIRNWFSPGLRIVNPHFSWHQISFLSAEGVMSLKRLIRH